VWLAALAVVTLAGCKDSNNVSGIPATPTPAATRTPTPVPISGNWTGSWESNLIVFCDQEQPGTSAATFEEVGSVITGTISATGGCNFAGSVQAARSGDQLTGSAMEGDSVGLFSGTLVGAELQISIGNLSNGSSTLIGGTAVLHRP
jgi:hypothetical protein